MLRVNSVRLHLFDFTYLIHLKRLGVVSAQPNNIEGGRVVRQ